MKEAKQKRTLKKALLLAVMASVMFLSLSEAGSAYINVNVHSPQSEKVTDFSDFRFTFNFTSSSFASANCLLYIVPSSQQTLGELDIVKNETVSNNTMTTWSVADFEKSIPSSYQYKYKIRCDSGVTSDEIQYTFSNTVVPFAKLYPLEEYSNSGWITVCGYVQQPSTTVTINRTDENSENLDEVITTSSNIASYPVASNISISLNAPEGQNYIIVGSNDATSLYVGSYIEFGNHDRECYKRYSIQAINDYGPNSKKIRISPGLETALSSGQPFSAYTTEKPRGWFEGTISLLPGENHVRVKAERSNIFHGSNLEEIIYDNENPVIQFSPKGYYNTKPAITFNATDNYEVNRKRMIVNMTTPNGSVISYVMSGTSFDTSHLTLGANIQEISPNRFRFNPDFSEIGYYEFNVYVEDKAGNWDNSIKESYFINVAPGITLTSGTHYTEKNITLEYLYNSSVEGECSLYINGTLNQTKNADPGISEVKFNITGSQQSYLHDYKANITVGCSDVTGNTNALLHNITARYLPREIHWNYRETEGRDYFLTNVLPFSIYGFVSLPGVLIDVYAIQGSDSKVASTISITQTPANPVVNTTQAAQKQNAGDCYVFISKADTQKAVAGNHLRFEEHMLNNHTLYRITEKKNMDTRTRLNLSPCLAANVSADETIYIYAEGNKPEGWFSSSLSLFPGVNNISITTSKYGQDGISVLRKVLVYDSQGPNITAPDTAEFNDKVSIGVAAEDYSEINFSRSWMNLSSAGNQTDYVNATALAEKVTNELFNQSTYKHQYFLNYSNNEMDDGKYNLTLHFTDNFGQSSSKTVAVELDTHVNPVEKISFRNFTITDKPTLFFNWSEVYDQNDVIYNYELLESLERDKEDEFKAILNGSTNNTYVNLTIENPKSRHGYKLKVITEDSFGNIGEPSYSRIYTFLDLSQPYIQYLELIPNSNYTNLANNLRVAWNYTTKYSTILEYKGCIGEMVNNDFGSCKWHWEPESTANNYTISDISLEHGKNYFVSLRAFNDGGPSEYSYINFTVDREKPHSGWINYPTGKVFYSSQLNLTGNFGNDDLSGFARGAIYAMSAPITGNLSCGGFSEEEIIYTGVTQEFSVYYDATNGRCYKFYVRTWDKAGNFRDFYYAGELIDSNNTISYVDTTRPSPVVVSDQGFFTSVNSLYFEWTKSSDPESGISRYHYELFDEENNVLESGTTKWNVREIWLNDLNLTNSMTYFLRVWAENGVGLTSNISVSNGIVYRDIIPPDTVQIVSVSGGNIFRLGSYYDLSEDDNTVVFFRAENGAICKASEYNIGYTELYSIADCQQMNERVNNTNLYNCSLPTEQEAAYTFYISCKDAFGNWQDEDLSKEINIVKTNKGPSIRVIHPEPASDVLIFSSYDQIKVNISTFAPIKTGGAKYIYGNATFNKAFSLSVTSAGDGVLLGQQIVNLTNKNDKGMWLKVYIEDVFNRSTSEEYSVMINEGEPKVFTARLNDYYDKQADIDFDVVAASFTNASILIKNSSGAVMLNESYSFESKKEYEIFTIQLNLTKPEWKADRYTVNVSLINSENNHTFTLSQVFYADDEAPVIHDFGINKGSSTGDDTLYDTDEPNFLAEVGDFPAGYNNSGLDTVTVEYSVNYFGQEESFTKNMSWLGEITWIKGLPAGSFKPGSIITYKIKATDNSGNSVESSTKSFSILNRAPIFETDAISSYGYAGIVLSETINISDPDIFTNITCSISAVFPEEIQSNVTVSKISNEACRLVINTKHVGDVNITLNASDGIGSTEKNYTVSIRPTYQVNLSFFYPYYIFSTWVFLGDLHGFKPAWFDSEQKRIYVPENEDTRLKFTYQDITILTEMTNKSALDGIEVKFKEKTLTTINSSELSLGESRRYVPKKAYALEINKPLTYTIYFSYGGLDISNPNKLTVFRIPYDFTTRNMDFSNGKKLSASKDDASESLVFTQTDFSIIVLAEDTHKTSPDNNRGVVARREPPTCNDSIKNQDETDVDCGGELCPLCGLGKSCLINTDCITNYCLNGTCQARPTCNDSIKNQDETDIDCGGTICSPCSGGRSCIINKDCQSNYCYNGICRTPTCSDGIKNQDETDVDCGGAICSPCEAGKTCKSSSDCISKNCVNGICREATCGDGIKNQDETDVDCGGLNCSKCPDSRTCIRNDDCLSGYCYNGICRTPTCSDGIKNQDEEGIDCGGPCLPCEEEKPGLITQDLLAIGGIFLSLFLAIIIILVIAFKNKKRRRVVEKVMFKNRYDSHEKVQGYTPAYASGMQDPEQPEESPQGQGNAVSPDESIVKGYLKKLVEKLVSDGRGYYDIKSEIIKKGYTESKYLAFIKEEYMNNMIRQIKQDIESLKEKGFSDDQIKEYLIKSGFSENDIEKVFR